MNALAPIAGKLAKLLPMLATDQDGELVAAARAIGRTLQSVDCSFHDLALALTVPVVKPQQSAPPDPENWGVLAKWCRDRRALLNAREAEFVDDMARKLILRGQPTGKQGQWLRSIYARLSRETAQ